MELQQDALDEAFRRHKNYFQHFLENEVRLLFDHMHPLLRSITLGREKQERGTRGAHPRSTHVFVLSHVQDGFGNYSEKLRTMMNQKTSRLTVDLNDLREYDSSFTDPTTSGQDNIADRYIAGDSI